MKRQAFPDPASSPTPSRGRRTIAAVGLQLLIIWGIAAALLWVSYRTAVEDWEKVAHGSSLATAAYVRQSLNSADLVLKSVQDWVVDNNIESEDDFRTLMADQRFSSALRDRIVGTPQISTVLIAALNGDIVNSTAGVRAPPLNIAAHEAFDAQMAKGAPSFSMTGLVRTLDGGRWAFFMSRRVLSTSGDSLGVTLVGLDSDYVSTLFRQISEGSKSTISLLRTDGALLATTIDDPALLGRRFEDAAALRLVRQGKANIVSLAEGPRFANPIDQRSRIVAPRSIDGYPLVVAVVVTNDVYLADWWREMYIVLAIACILTVIAFYVDFRFAVFSAASQEADRLATERRLLSTLLDTPSALCALIDRQGRQVYCNQRFSDLLAPNGDLAAALADPALKGADKALRFAMEGQESTAELDLRLERPGEPARFLHFSLSSQSLPELGECAVMVGHDETGRHQAQLAIAQAANMVTLGEMTTGIAHELSQPLNVIRMAAQNALTEIAPAEGADDADQEFPLMTDAEFRGFAATKLTRIMAQVDRAADILARMRIFGRAPAGGARIFDAREACRSALLLVGERIRGMGITIAETLGPEPLFVSGHQNQLEQVVVNLLLNARDALKDQRGPNRRIEVSAMVGPNGDILIRVADNGPGVPAEIRERIFEPFFTAKPFGSGTGLGLALSFGIVRDAGGVLSLLPGTTGATFQIALPAAADAAEEAPAPGSAQESAPGLAPGSAQNGFNISAPGAVSFQIERDLP